MPDQVPMRVHFVVRISLCFLLMTTITNYASVVDIYEGNIKSQLYFYWQHLIVVMSLGAMAWFCFMALCFISVGLMMNRDEMFYSALKLILIAFIYTAVPIVTLSYLGFSSAYTTKGDAIRTAIMEYETDPDAAEALDVLQRKYQCCGATKVSDWALPYQGDLSKDSWKSKIPKSCFMEKQETTSDKPAHRKRHMHTLKVPKRFQRGEEYKFLNTQGCEEMVVKNFKDLTRRLAYETFMFALCEVNIFLVLWLGILILEKNEGDVEQDQEFLVITEFIY